MKEFINKNKGVVFRYWIRKRMWTPYELDQKDPLQSDVVDEECSYGYLIEAINLGYDWLIGISDYSENFDFDNIDYITYYKLSEIDLAYNKNDQD